MASKKKTAKSKEIKSEEDNVPESSPSTPDAPPAEIENVKEEIPDTPEEPNVLANSLNKSMEGELSAYEEFEALESDLLNEE